MVEFSAMYSFTPTLPHHLRLLQHQFHGRVLQVRQVLLLAQNSFHQASVFASDRLRRTNAARNMSSTCARAFKEIGSLG